MDSIPKLQAERLELSTDSLESLILTASKELNRNYDKSEFLANSRSYFHVNRLKGHFDITENRLRLGNLFDSGSVRLRCLERFLVATVEGK